MAFLPEPPDIWQAIEAVALATIAGFAWLNNRKAVKNRKAADVQISHVGESVREVGRKLDNTTNGPLLVALGTNARLSSRIARLTHDAIDIKAADAASKALEDFLAEKAFPFAEPCPDCQFFRAYASRPLNSHIPETNGPPKT